jgi:hypothetical protein
MIERKRVIEKRTRSYFRTPSFLWGIQNEIIQSISAIRQREKRDDYDKGGGGRSQEAGDDNGGITSTYSIS